MEGVFDTTSREGKSAAAMREGDAEFWKPLENTAENHGANGEGRFSWHADEPRQPILWHPFLAHHVPRMNEEGGAGLLGRAPDWLERRVVQVQNVEATRVWIGIDMCADLRAAQSEFVEAALEFASRQIGVLHRDCRKAHEPFRMFAHNLRDVIV